MTSLNIRNNGLLNRESGKALADALKENSVLKELDVSNNYDEYNSSSRDGSGFTHELAIGIGANGALETITFGDVHTVTMQASITEADFSGKELGAPGAIIVAAFLPKCQ